MCVSLKVVELQLPRVKGDTAQSYPLVLTYKGYCRPKDGTVQRPERQQNPVSLVQEDIEENPVCVLRQCSQQ